MALPIDKRDHPRLTKRVNLRYRSVGGKWRSAFTKDVATTGLYVVATSMPVSTSIDVEVVDDGQTIALKGAVLRRNKVQGGFALKLIDVPVEWCRLCLDLEEKARERGSGSSTTRFMQVGTDVMDVKDL